MADLQGIKIGSEWMHVKSGRVYRVYDFTNLGSNEIEKYPPRVSYHGTNGSRWSRSISDWHRSMRLLSETTTAGQPEWATAIFVEEPKS